MKSLSPVLCALLLAASWLPGFGQDQKPGAGLFWPKAPERARITFLYALGGKHDVVGEKSWFRKALDVLFGGEQEGGQMLRPQAVAVDSGGRIYVSDTRARGIHVFDAEHQEYRFLAGEGDHAFVSPVGLAVGDDGAVYVADTDLREIIVLTPDGEYAWRIAGGLRRPTGLRIFDGLLYVADTQAHQIVVYDLKGHEQYRFGKRGTSASEFNFPVYLTSGPRHHGEQPPLLYVVDALNGRVQTFRENGVFVGTFGKPGDAVGDLARPKGIALDSDGHIYVADALFDVIQVFDQKGQLLLSFGGSGSGPGLFSLPAGLATDARDRLYVVDSGNRRIQVFQYLK